MDKKDFKHHPNTEYRFWLYDPEADGMTYWRSQEARDDAAKHAIDAYLDDDVGWSDEVKFVSAGVVTHTPHVLDKRQRPDDLDEEQCDGDGTYWGDLEWTGRYAMMPLPTLVKLAAAKEKE